jgi:hypothetical protein
MQIKPGFSMTSPMICMTIQGHGIFDDSPALPVTYVTVMEGERERERDRDRDRDRDRERERDRD